MGDVVLQVSAVSLNGLVVADGTHVDAWANEPDAERDQWMTDSLSQASVHAMGSTTYRSMARHWPTSTEVFAEPMNRIPKAVFSRRMRSADAGWGPVQVCSGDTREDLARLQQDDAGPVVVHGGITFMRSLAQLDVVDEYRLVVGPWLAGSGAALFQGVLDDRRLALQEATRFPGGSLALVYRRQR